MKLTPKQNMVIYCLQNGWKMLTDQSESGAWIVNEKYEFHINNGIIWRLMEKTLIGQSLSSPFEFGLTLQGRKIKTKPVTINQ